MDKRGRKNNVICPGDCDKMVSFTMPIVVSMHDSEFFVAFDQEKYSQALIAHMVGTHLAGARDHQGS